MRLQKNFRNWLLNGNNDLSVVAELKQILYLAVPMVLVTMWILLIPPISSAFCGRLGSSEFGAATMAHLIFDVFGMNVAMGATYACDTFFSQTFGSSNKKGVGLHLQKSFLIILLFCFPCWAIQANAKGLLTLLGENTMIIELTDQYLLYYMPSLVAAFCHIILLKYFVTQNKVAGCVLIGAIGSGACALFHVLFLNYWHFGVVGSAVAAGLSYCVMLAAQLSYILGGSFYKVTWSGWSLEALEDWSPFLSLAVPGIFMLLFEWGAEGVFTFLAGALGEVQLGTQSVLFYIQTLFFMIPYGIGDAAGIRLGQLLGEFNKEKALISVKLSCLTAAVVACINFAILGAFSSVLPRLFTTDELIVENSQKLFMFLMVFQSASCLEAVGGGLMRGSGRQLRAMCLQFFAYYVVALPLGISLGFFTDLSIVGFWIALLTGAGVQVVGLAVMIVRVDWQRECELAAKRAAIGLDTDSIDGDSETSSACSDEETGLLRKQFDSASQSTLPTRYSSVDLTASASASADAPFISAALVAKRILIFVLFLLMFAAGIVVRQTLHL